MTKHIEEKSEKPMELDFEQELYKHFGQVKDFTLGMRIGQYFYELGCRRTAEKYDEIEYNRQRASVSSEIPKDLEEAAENCVWESIDGNDQTLVPKFIPLLLSLFISGAKWQKEQMMRVAVEGIVTTRSMAGNIVTAHVDYRYKDGQKVRIIVCKKED